MKKAYVFPGDHIRSESFVALRQNDGVQEYCRLCDACCLEVIRRALKHYVSDSESKYVIRLLEQFLAFGVSLVKRFRHTNCGGQVVISGEKTAVEQACEKAKAEGAKRALPLAVSGAFHSPLMEPARVELGKAIEETRIVEPICPIYQNVSAQAVTDPQTIKKNLLAQLTSPVRWTQSVRNMLADGADYFMEIGPGTVLQGLVKRISAGTEGITIEGLTTI